MCCAAPDSRWTCSVEKSPRGWVWKIGLLGTSCELARALGRSRPRYSSDLQGLYGMTFALRAYAYG